MNCEIKYNLYSQWYRHRIITLAAAAFISMELMLAQDPLYMDVGRLQAVFMGNFYESFEHAGAIYRNDYGRDNWLYWPAEYARVNEDDHQGLLGAAGLYLAVSDFYDQDSAFHSYYHAAVWGDRGPRDHRIRMADADRYRLWYDPIVVVDDFIRPSWSYNLYPYNVAELMIENVAHSTIGLTVTRRAYGWSMQDHDDYIIMEYILENTGKVMKQDGFGERPVRIEGWPQQLNDVWFALCFRFQPSSLGADHIGTWGGELQPGSGHDVRHDYIGETYGRPGQQMEDSIRALIAWDGDAEPIGYDDTGNPHVLTGVLLSPQYVGVAIMHVDNSPNDHSNDPRQPATTDWRGEYRGRYAFDQTQYGPPGLPDSVVYQYLSNGRHDQLLPNQGGLDNLGEGHGYFLGFGPYNFGPNEYIRIVTAYAAGGISRTIANQAGRRWKAGEISDEEKNAILATGRDSLIVAFQQAKQMLSATEDLTRRPEELMAPPPPASFTVTSEVGQINLEWDGAPSETVDDFAGYRIYRNHVSSKPITIPSAPPDTLFDLIYEMGGASGNTVLHSYVDSTVETLTDYVYYVSAYDTGGNQSGMYYLLPLPDIHARAGTPPDPYAPLESVVVYPNPSINRATNREGSYGRRIEFTGLPEICTIRIYTQSGNLVKVIEHNDSDGDEAWMQDTMNNQNVSSGVYIYTVESLIGNAMGSLVIIR